MTKIIYAALAASALLIPAAASAQALPAPVIAVVDTQRIQSQCNACRTALSQLEAQLAGLRTLQTTLETPLRAENTAIQAAGRALNGRAPDAALQARATAFEAKTRDAQRQLAAREEAFQRNRAHVLQQINAKLEPALVAVSTRRGASVLLDSSAVLRSAPALDVTADVLAAVNSSLTSISTTAPAQAAPARR
ncbi:MAG: OmpH family outer membrane protein [Pseudomonadota bacterium]|nr:OmpH family outer membrane protein [Pseudomonadota bacterium]